MEAERRKEGETSVALHYIEIKHFVVLSDLGGGGGGGGPGVQRRPECSGSVTL